MKTTTVLAVFILAILLGVLILARSEPSLDNPEHQKTLVAVAAEVPAEEVGSPSPPTLENDLREEVAQSDPIVVMNGEHGQLTSGLVRINVLRSNAMTVADIGLGDDYNPTRDEPALQALQQHGGVALLALCDGEKFQIANPRINAEASLPITLNARPGGDPILRVTDSQTGVDLENFDLLTAAVPLRPDFADRNDSRLGWSPYLTHAESPMRLESALPASTWVFKSGYVPELLPRYSLFDGLTAISMDRTGVLVLDHSKIQDPCPDSITIDSRSWQGSLKIPITNPDWTELELPEGHFEIALSAKRPQGTWEMWRGSCTVIPGQTSRVVAEIHSSDSGNATVSGMVSCKGGLASIQNTTLISIVEQSGTGGVKIVQLRPLDERGEDFVFGPIEMSPGRYRVTLNTQSFGQTLDLQPGQTEYLQWTLPGIATVELEFIDADSGALQSPAFIGYWQDATGMAPPEGSGTQMKTIGFPTARTVKLVAGVTWFRFGYSMGKPPKLESRELIPGEQKVTFIVGASPQVDLTLVPEDGDSLNVANAPSSVWVRWISDSLEQPARGDQWIRADVIPKELGSSSSSLTLTATLPAPGTWEVLIPPIDGYLQPAPVRINTTAEQVVPSFPMHRQQRRASDD